MSDNKKYYYLKLKDNFFDSEEIKVLESLPNGIYYSNLLIKLYLKSLKFNGGLRFNDYIPYDENMIATITNLNVDIVRSGLKILSSIKLIERLDDGTIYMTNIQSYIGKSSNEGDRKKLYREKIEEKKQLVSGYGKNHGQMSSLCPIDNPLDVPIDVSIVLDKRPPEIEKEKEIEIEKEIEKEIELKIKREIKKDIGLKIKKDKDKDKDKDEELGKVKEIKENIPENVNINTNTYINSIVACKEQIEEEVELLQGFLKTFIKGQVPISKLNLKIAVINHGFYNVKKAIEMAANRNKISIRYINGILRNWEKEGYPMKSQWESNEGDVIKKGENKEISMGGIDHGGFRKNIKNSEGEEGRRGEKLTEYLSESKRDFEEDIL